MRIKILVKPNSKQANIEKMEDGSLKVWVKAPPRRGMANQELRQLLGAHFDCGASKINIIKGLTSPNKTVDIL